jgi:hypothetical protein
MSAHNQVVVKHSNNTTPSKSISEFIQEKDLTNVITQAATKLSPRFPILRDTRKFTPVINLINVTFV